MKADCFSYTNILKTLRNGAAKYLFLPLSGSQSSRFWRTRLFLIGGQIKIKFCMGSNHAICTKFSQRPHDALNFAEKHIRRRDRLFFCLRDSSFEFKRLKKVRIFFFFLNVYLYYWTLAFFLYSEVLNSCRFVGEPMQNQIQKLHIFAFLRKIAW